MRRWDEAGPVGRLGARALPIGPPGRPDPATPPRSRAATASSAKNRAVAALTRTIPSRRPSWLCSTLPMPAADASGPPIAIPRPSALAQHAVLALDLGTTTGWALRGRDGGITSGTMTFKPSRFEGGGMRYLRFRRWLDEVAALAGCLARVVFEEVRAHAGTDAAHIYGGFLGQLTAWCEERGVPYEGVPVGTIKRFATGKGNADKAAMVAAMQARGFRPRTTTRPMPSPCCSGRRRPTGGRA